MFVVSSELLTLIDAVDKGQGLGIFGAVNGNLNIDDDGKAPVIGDANAHENH